MKINFSVEVDTETIDDHHLGNLLHELYLLIDILEEMDRTNESNENASPR